MALGSGQLATRAFLQARHLPLPGGGVQPAAPGPVDLSKEADRGIGEELSQLLVRQAAFFAAFSAGGGGPVRKALPAAVL